MTVKERIKEFIIYKGLSVRSFENKCGLSYGYIANIRVSIQPEKVMSIAEQFPDLNTGWLLTGEGKMLKDEQSKAEINNATVAIPAEAWDVIKKQAESLASKDRQVEELITLLKKGNAQKDENAICADASGSDLVK